MKNIAVYAGTFDPITYGHIDLIERALTLFDRVIIGIAASPGKHPLLALEERVNLAKDVLSKYEQVEVHGFDSLLLDFAKLHGANIFLRGLRTVTDFDYEFQLASMNRHLLPDIQTIFLMPSENHMYISSTLVREVAMLGGDVTAFVPPQVVSVLKKKRK